MSEPRKRQDAPDPGLELVREFVNTRDVDEDMEQFSDPAGLADWLVGHGLAAPSTRATKADLARATALREALRVQLLHNGGHHADVTAQDELLDAAARRAKLRVGFGPGGESGLVAEAGGVDGGLGRILAEVHRAQADGTWMRLKACADDACLWAFYDHTKNRSGRWCTMAECGNRAKARSFRERRAGAA